MNLNDKHVLNVIKFQRKYRFLKNELKTIDQRLIFLKDYLLNQINNISFLRTYGIVDQNNISVEIINELEPCIELLKNFPDELSFKKLKETEFTISSMNLNLIKISNHLKKFSNLIAPNSMNYILKLFYNENWLNLLDESETDNLLFLSRFFNIITVWESDIHTEEIKIEKKSNNSKLISKDILENLLGGDIMLSFQVKVISRHF